MSLSENSTGSRHGSPVRATTVCILAGGRGGRIGGDKCGKILGNRRLIDYSLELSRRLVTAGLAERVVIAGGVSNLESGDAELIEDLAGAGPMAGLHACLVRYGRTLLLPCDMPFLNTPFLRLLLEKSRHTDIVTCRVGELVQPQVGVYSAECLGAVDEMIGQGRYSLFRMLQEGGLKVLVLEEEDVERFGDPVRLFLNINTADDLRHAEKLLGRG
jgi:molybdopterin-guanine dinucleotide biosynthesis protein A